MLTPITMLLATVLATREAASPPPTLRVGMDPRLVPWVFVPGHDNMKDTYLKPPALTPQSLARVTGLEVDILRALERRLGVRCEIVQSRWLDLESDLLASRFDVILNAWTPTDGTPAAILATDPYYDWGLLVVTRSEEASIRTLQDLSGRRLGHFADPSVVRAVRAMSESLGARLVPVNEGAEEMFLRLAQGDVDAIVFDSVAVRWRVARDRAFRVVGEPLNALGYHAGVRASDVALWQRLQAAVRDYVASPESREIRRRWESADVPSP